MSMHLRGSVGIVRSSSCSIARSYDPGVRDRAILIFVIVQSFDRDRATCT